MFVHNFAAHTHGLHHHQEGNTAMATWTPLNVVLGVLEMQSVLFTHSVREVNIEMSMWHLQTKWKLKWWRVLCSALHRDKLASVCVCLTSARGVRLRRSVREVIVPFQGQCNASARLVLIVGDYFRFADRWGDRNVIILTFANFQNCFTILHHATRADTRRKLPVTDLTALLSAYWNYSIIL